MRKILLVILTLTIVFGLGACDNASPETDYVIKSELELLELEIQAIQERIDSLVFTHGLNGTVSVYENQSTIDTLTANMITLSIEYMVVKDTFDKEKDAPAYIKDEFGGYVSFYDLGSMLQEKYYDETTLNRFDIFEIGSKAYLQFQLDGEHTTDELLAKTILLIEEVRNYDFYVLSCNELEIYIMWHTADYSESYRMSITIPLVVIINSYFEITLNGVVDGDYEMKLWLYETSIIETNAQLIYDDYKTNLTYDGYVLDYEIK